MKKQLQEDQKQGSLGMYVHVPFCATTCNFCAFVQRKPNRELIQMYLQAVEAEWKLRSRQQNWNFDTLFWGGGTPGLLLPSDLEHLGKVFEGSWEASGLSEWTVEMAPSTVTPSKLAVLKDLGVTRISMGVQTFCDETLKIMDRFHSVAQIHRAWKWIQAAGFKSCNIDMIIAYPGQTRKQLIEDLEKAIALEPDHVSTYCLTFEEDTPLYAKLMQGVYKIDRDAEADLYQAAWEFLESNGFHQYEISNFAKPGHKSIHNCNTWNMQEWIGFGPSASSQHKNKRWTNSYDFETWSKGCLNGTPMHEELISIDEETLLTDSIVFGLRMNAGIDLQYLETRFHPQTILRWRLLFDRLIAENLAIQKETQFSLTLGGRLLADAIAVEVLKCADA